MSKTAKKSTKKSTKHHDEEDWSKDGEMDRVHRRRNLRDKADRKPAKSPYHKFMSKTLKELGNDRPNTPQPKLMELAAAAWRKHKRDNGMEGNARSGKKKSSGSKTTKTTTKRKTSGSKTARPAKAKTTKTKTTKTVTKRKTSGSKTAKKSTRK